MCDSLLYGVIEELTAELRNEPMFDPVVLEVKVKNAIREVKLRRNYKCTSMTEEEIENDLENYWSVVVNVARYDYNQIGIEGQSYSSEDGVIRTYINRDSLFGDVVPYVNVLF